MVIKSSALFWLVFKQCGERNSLLTQWLAFQGSSWPCGQDSGLAVVRSPVRTLPPRAYSGALVVWPGMPFPNLDGKIHQSPFLAFHQSYCSGWSQGCTDCVVRQIWSRPDAAACSSLNLHYFLKCSDPSLWNLGILFYFMGILFYFTIIFPRIRGAILLKKLYSCHLIIVQTYLSTLSKNQDPSCSPCMRKQASHNGGEHVWGCRRKELPSQTHDGFPGARPRYVM